jgi:hypothetical protein
MMIDVSVPIASRLVEMLGEVVDCGPSSHISAKSSFSQLFRSVSTRDKRHDMATLIDEREVAG